MKALKHLLGFTVPFFPFLLLGILLSSLTIYSNIGLMTLSAFLLSWSALSPPILYLMPAIAGVRFFGLARAVFRYLERYYNHRTTFRILGRIRVWIYQVMEEKFPGELLSEDDSRLFSQMVADVEALKDFYLRVLLPPLTALVVMLTVAILLLTLSPLMCGTFLLFYLVIALGLPFLIKVFQQTEKLSEIRSSLESLISDSLHGLTDLLVYDREQNQLSKVKVKSLELTKFQEKWAGREALANALTSVLSHLGMLIIMIEAIPLVQNHQIPALWFAPLALGVLSSFEGAAPVAQSLPFWEESFHIGQRFLNTQTVKENPSPATNSIEEGLENSPLNLEIRHLSFSYPDTSDRVLNDISLSLAAKEKLAIIGPSGSGKSTLMNLLLRFWDYQNGSVSLGGTELNQWPREELWAVAGVVSRQAYLFAASIRENLCLAKPDASEEELFQALAKAQLLSFVQSLPDGIETVIGEGGNSLSGGQRQLLSLARAILKDPPLLILDEATEGLDYETAEKVLESIGLLTVGKTAIMVTHRLDDLKIADRVMVLNEGHMELYHPIQAGRTPYGACE